jgi:hypothetical protein
VLKCRISAKKRYIFSLGSYHESNDPPYPPPASHHSADTAATATARKRRRQDDANSTRGGGRCGWRSSFIVLTIICITVRTDAITIVRCVAKHKSVLNQNTFVFDWQNTFVFCKTHLCFQSVGPFVAYTFGRTLIFLKNEIGFSNISDFKKIWNRAKTFFLCAFSIAPPPPLIHCLPGGNKILPLC